MTKAKAPKRRHIMIEVKEKITEEDLKALLYREALRFFGEYGCSFLQLKITKHEPEKNLWIITCARDYADKVRGFLTLIEKPRIIAKKTSGTMKKLKEKIICS
ncbi:MAG: Rpp14/Pop5 family protein [Candidatus Bilamarchaeaceae archaeon]